MQPERWLIHIADMLAAIEAISEYTANVTMEEFFTSHMLFDSVIRQFTVLGEAANPVHPDIQERYPDIPWMEMRDLRNFIVHQYDDINRRTIWDTIHMDLPSAYEQVKRIFNNE